jgi:integrase
MLQQQAKRSANSYLRNARSMFSRQILEKVNVALPSPLPFADVELERHVGSTRYQSTFNAADLLVQAKLELAGSDPDGFAVFLLALGAGLRRGEIDNLQSQQVDFAAGAIRVMPLRHFIPKTDSSEGVVFVDPMLLSELAKVRSACPSPKTLFVIEPNTEARQTRAAQYYRAAATFGRLTAWLRANGVDSSKPLHALRKEFGSILCAAADIHTASRMLRHSNLTTTAAYYVEARRSTVVPIGDMMRKVATA